MARSTSRPRLVRYVVAAAGVVGVAFVSARVGVARDAARTPPPSIAECPHDWPVLKERGISNQLNLPGGTTNVPEFHDCQRLIRPDGKYGPLVAVFAWDSLNLLRDSVLSLQHSGTTRKAVGAAEIWNVDAVGYSPLGIKPGFSCLYLYGFPRWRAKLVHYGATEPDCRTPIDPGTTPGVDMVVARLPATGPGYTTQHVPPVARWETQPKTGLHHIGLKCEPTTWCEIGRAGFARSRAINNSPTVPANVRSRHEIKGWYDEQVLAAASTGATATPSGVMANVFPAHDLASRSLGTYSTWQEVAYVKMDQANPGYLGKANFVGPEPGGIWTANDSAVVFMCRGVKSACLGIPNDVSCAAHPGDTVPWWARIEARNRAPKYKCVHYRKNPNGVASPGTVRWRWVAKDETIWVGCPTGCCEVELGDN
jgi:hypothetical protein